MINPLVALIVAVLVVGGLVVLFWPVSGMLWRILRSTRHSERVLIEDALKHLYDCEYRQAPCTLQSLSGALELSGNKAAALLDRLEQLDLVQVEGGRYVLTTTGRTYALRVIRIHRLWEHYFSEETGLDASEWHAEAEIREHRTSPEEAEALAARMGFPRYDPHGDPIPTADGEIAPPRGRPVTALQVGQTAEIVHVEDEPHAVYAQLLAEGLQPGSRVRVLERSPHRVRLESDGDEHILAPVVAANLSAIELEEQVEPSGSVERLSALRLGEKARVTGFSAACRGPERRRMLDLGIVPGTEVEAEMKSPGGDPTAYRIRGAVIALRRAQAAMIHIEPVADGSAS
jgi:DtxR family Mn-dependent transcriptional regulator